MISEIRSRARTGQPTDGSILGFVATYAPLVPAPTSTLMQNVLCQYAEWARRPFHRGNRRTPDFGADIDEADRGDGFIQP